jgi:hypothetical protein
MATPQDAQVRSVMFLADSFQPLVEKTHVSDQLHAVVDLMQFANAYVLNDTTIIGGNVRSNEFDREGRFLASSINSIIASSDGLATADDASAYRPGSPRGKHDVGQCLRDVGLSRYDERADLVGRELDRAEREFSEGDGHDDAALKKKINALRHELTRAQTEGGRRQMQAYMMLADKLNADFVPEYKYGVDAVLTYGDLLQEIGMKKTHRKEIHEAFQKFSGEFVQYMSSLGRRVEPNSFASPISSSRRYGAGGMWTSS